MGQLDIFGGEHEPLSSAQVPDPALSRRLARRDVNRSLVADAKERGTSTRVGMVRGTPNEPFAKERINQSTADFGVPPGDLVGGGQRSHFKPFANAEFRRLGTYKELPNDSFVSQQGEVDRRRVKELAADPGLGRNPRIPDEKPLVVHAMARAYDRSDQLQPGRTIDAAREANVIINGNHRIMGGIARNEMFSPAQVVEANEDNEEAAGKMRSSIEQDLPYAAHGTRALRDPAMPPDAASRTKAFVEEQRRNYWDAGAS